MGDVNKVALAGLLPGPGCPQEKQLSYKPTVHIERVTFTLIHWKYSYIRSQDKMWKLLCLEYRGSNSCFESSVKIKTQFWFSWWKKCIFPNSVLCLPCSCPPLNIYGWMFFHERMKSKNFNLWQISQEFSLYFLQKFCAYNSTTNQIKNPCLMFLHSLMHILLAVHFFLSLPHSFSNSESSWVSGGYNFYSSTKFLQSKFCPADTQGL